MRYTGYLHLKDNIQGVQVEFEDDHVLFDEDPSAAQFLEFEKRDEKTGKTRGIFVNTRELVYIDYWESKNVM